MNDKEYIVVDHFAFSVFYSDEDQAWIAALTEPTNWGLSGIGDTRRAAMEELAIIIDIALDDED